MPGASQAKAELEAGLRTAHGTAVRIQVVPSVDSVGGNAAGIVPALILGGASIFTSTVAMTRTTATGLATTGVGGLGVIAASHVTIGAAGATGLSGGSLAALGPAAGSAAGQDDAQGQSQGQGQGQG